MIPHSIRLTEMQAAQLAYLTERYGSQSSAIRAAIDLLYQLRRLEELGGLDVEQLRACLAAAGPPDNRPQP
jgi:Arc/MetJ-type ribon-helix-helix transcriptional regulator